MAVKKNGERAGHIVACVLIVNFSIKTHLGCVHTIRPKAAEIDMLTCRERRVFLGRQPHPQSKGAGPQRP